MKWPRSLPDIRDEMRKLCASVKNKDRTDEYILDRLELLANCLTEAIVDQARTHD